MKNNNHYINQIVKIKEFHCKIDLEITYYTHQQGIIRGIKILEHNICIYLIEFMNLNRIWATRKEFEF